MNHTSFEQAVAAQPHDIALRLVFADWLEEHGELERATFIRMQCAVAELPKYDVEWVSLTGTATCAQVLTSAATEFCA